MTQDSANSGAPVRRKTVLIVAMLVMVIVSLAALWRLTPLSEFADPDRLAYTFLERAPPSADARCRPRG